jgi:23S rRNA (adenine2030-N6)-methyltransferase
LLPPRAGGERFTRGLVLIDPPYEKQQDEYDVAIPAVREGLERWAQGMYALWYPVKTRRALHPVFRRAATLPAKSILAVELLVRPDDSPLRMNGSGMLLFNPPWRFDDAMRSALPALAAHVGEAGGGWRVQWLKAPE